MIFNVYIKNNVQFLHEKSPATSDPVKPIKRSYQGFIALAESEPKANMSFSAVTPAKDGMTNLSRKQSSY